jgi:hypothetical protein
VFLLNILVRIVIKGYSQNVAINNRLMPLLLTIEVGFGEKKEIF